ncbi:helix-turn-helix domain-containing protein [Pedobacter sp. NJ-S-72]
MNSIIEALLIGPTLMVALLIFANFQQVNLKASRWLSVFVLLIFIVQIGVLSEDTHAFVDNSPILELIYLANYMIAPVFYLSTIYYIEPDYKWRRRDNLHFLFVGLMMFLTILSFFLPADQSDTPNQKEMLAKTVLLFNSIFCLQVLSYCFAAFYSIIKYQKNLPIYVSNIQYTNLHWLKKIVICVLLVAVLWLADGLFKISAGSVIFDYTSTILYFIGVYYIAHHALQQKELFPFRSEEKQQLETIIAESELSIKKKLLSDEQLAEHVQLLKQLMDAEKPYVDYEVSLIRLAQQFKTSPHLLSYIINTGFRENFFQFINRYRVEEARKMILDPKMNRLNLIGIAYESGFKSKTVFNTNFKKKNYRPNPLRVQEKK